MKTALLFALLFISINVTAQDGSKISQPVKAAAAERELRDFYEAYAADLRLHRKGAVADRYDSRGYFSLGNGNKRFVTFDDNKKYYTTQWTGPKSFEWRDLSFEVLSPEAATVVGIFDWTNESGVVTTGSYTSVLTKRSGQWRIRVEDESFNATGYSIKVISGDRLKPGPFKYTVTADPGTSIGAHRHPQDVRITVRSGRMFVLMGDLATAKAQRFDAGSTFVIPANTWHVEWWEDPTVVEADTTAPTATIRATPANPRVQ